MGVLSGQRLIVLPGLATDERVVEPQRPAFSNIEVLPWVVPDKADTMASYAAKMAASVPRPDEPFYLAGISFGGMVAYEMAQLIRPRALFLIGSCRSNEAVPGWITRAHQLIGTVAPPWLYMIVGGLIIGSTLMSEKITARERRVFRQMVRDTDPWLFKWSCDAVINWQPSGSPEGQGVPTHAVHGENDRLLLTRCVKADLVIPNAGHLISMTHAERVNRFLAERMDGQE